MTDDSRRHRRPDQEEAEDFGPPLFADSDDDTTDGLSFGASDTGPLPHWTEPPTGEMPRTLTAAAPSDPSDDLDVWSSFAGKAPVWSDDDPTGAHDETNEFSIGDVVWIEEHKPISKLKRWAVARGEKRAK